MVGIRDYSLVVGDNGSVDGTSYAPEGMAPSALNDCIRQIMRDAKEWWELLSGGLTTGGSANAQTLTPSRAWTEYTDGDRVLLKVGGGLTNTGATTLNVSGLGAKTVYRRDGATALSAGDLTAGTVYDLKYDAGINGFRLVDSSLVPPLGLSDLVSAAKGFDIGFTAGFTSVGTALDLTVQTYGFVVVGRALTIEGETGYLTTAGDGADVIVDVLKNGSTIYSTKPEFADGANTLTAGTLSTTTLAAGDRLSFAVTQIGSSTAGDQMAFTLKCRLA